MYLQVTSNETCSFTYKITIPCGKSMAKEKLKLLLPEHRGCVRLGRKGVMWATALCLEPSKISLCSCHTRSTCMKGLKDALGAGTPVL